MGNYGHFFYVSCVWRALRPPDRYLKDLGLTEYLHVIVCVLHMYRWFRASGAASFFARMLTAYAASRTTRLNAATRLNPWDYHMTAVVFVMRIGHEPTWYGKAMYCSRNCLKLGVLRTCFWQAHVKVLEFVYMQPRDTVLLTPLFFDQKQGVSRFSRICIGALAMQGVVLRAGVTWFH